MITTNNKATHYTIGNISHLRSLILYKEKSYLTSLFLLLFLSLFIMVGGLSGVVHVDGYTCRDLDNGIRGPQNTNVTY